MTLLQINVAVILKVTVVKLLYLWYHIKFYFQIYQAVSAFNPLAAEFIYQATSAECSGPTNRPTAVKGLNLHTSTKFCAVTFLLRKAIDIQAESQFFTCSDK